MSCKGLEGRALKRCMKKYVSTSKNIFPNFNKETDTTYNVASSNRMTNFDYIKNPKIKKEIEGADEIKTVKSNDPNDTHPYKLKIMRKKNGSNKL